jgi:hypothetical protein
MRSGRRWLYAGLAVVVVSGGVSGTWAATRSDHGDPDPDGRILTALTTVERALPADAQVMLRQANEPRWDSCDGRSGTFGWDNIAVDMQFRTREQPRALVADADNLLRAVGWRRTGTVHSPLGPGARWSRTVAGSTVASAMLAPGTSGDGVYWDLDALAPPQGQQVSGC